MELENLPISAVFLMRLAQSEANISTGSMQERSTGEIIIYLRDANSHDKGVTKAG